MLRLIIGRGANYPNIRVVEVRRFAEESCRAKKQKRAASRDGAGARRRGAPARDPGGPHA